MKLIIFVLLNLFKIIIVQERRCLFKECYCNNLNDDEVLIECSDSLSLTDMNFHKLERNLRIIIEKEIKSFNVTMLSIFITKSKFLYLPDYVFKFLNFLYLARDPVFMIFILAHHLGAA